MRDPVWVRGRVPNGFWDVRENRVRYMLWLRKRLGFRKTTDWYQLQRQHFLDHHGGGLLATVYRHSPLVALQDYSPQTKWLPWLMGKTPQGYWRDPVNRRRYMTWLGRTLGFKSDKDWHQLSRRHFHAHGGDGLMANYYRNSPLDALREFKPHTVWVEWQFAEAPQRFWHDPRNRRRYMKWLGERLGYASPDDWVAVKRSDFVRNQGASLLQMGHSPLDLLREAYPRHDWHPWRFPRVPNGYWKAPRHRAAFLQWLGKKQLRLRKAADWERVTRDQVREVGGGTLLSQYFGNSMSRLRNAGRAAMFPPPAKASAGKPRRKR